MTLDARSLTLPSIAVISIVAAFVWGTYMYSEDRFATNRRIDQTVTSVERLASSVKVLAEAMQVRAQDGYTKQDHIIFCLQAQTLNKGWRCPAFGDASTSADSKLKSSAQSVSRDIDDLLTKRPPE